MVLLWFNTTFGGQEAEPRACCARHFISMTSGPQTQYVRSVVAEPVDRARPWLPDGATAEGFYGPGWKRRP